MLTKPLLAVLCLAICLSSVACETSNESKSISLQVKTIYHEDIGEYGLEGVLRNESLYDLERVNLNNVRVFCKTPWGWDFFPHRRGRSNFEVDREFVLRAGAIEKLSQIGLFVTVYDMVFRKGPFMLEMGYHILSNKDKNLEYVVYSNEFTVPETLDKELTTEIQITVKNLSPRQIDLYNGTNEVLLYKPLCSEFSGDQAAVVDPYFADEKFTTLQRQTNQGTWQIFRPRPSDCTQVVAPVEIAPGEDVTLELWRGYPIERLDLQPGIYRWNVVYFRYNEISKEYTWAVHIFTQPQPMRFP